MRVTHREEAISFPQLPAQVSRTSCENEGDENSLSVLSTYDVKAQTCGSTVQHHFPRLSVMKHTHTQNKEAKRIFNSDPLTHAARYYTYKPHNTYQTKL